MSESGDAARRKTQSEGRRDSERPLDVSDLSPAAQARIRAAELEAQQIVEDGKQLSKIVAIREKIPWAKANPEPILQIVAEDRERVAHKNAACHVLEAVGNEYLKEGGLANESKVKAIGEWLCTRYGCSPGWLPNAMRLWRVAALRNQAIKLEGGQARFFLRTSARLMQPPKVHPASADPSERGSLDLLQAPGGELKRAVTLDVARRFGGVSRRAIEEAASKGSLKAEGKGPHRRVLVASLLEYFPSEK